MPAMSAGLRQVKVVKHAFACLSEMARLNRLLGARRTNETREPFFRKLALTLNGLPVLLGSHASGLPQHGSYLNHRHVEGSVAV